MMFARALLTGLAFATVLQVGGSAQAEIISSVQERYSEPQPNAHPDFQKHVAPLLGKLGCNGRACHGSFQGQGGFQLSLFGYDFKMDHKNLTEGVDPRVDLADPELSLILQKGTLNYPHKGGKRMEEGSWEYNVLHSWVKSGAPFLKDDKPTGLTKLEVTPKELLFDRSGIQVQMKAVAVWADGTREDVTPLCRFQVNDDTVADVDKTGLVVSKEPGDSHLVLFYDNAVVPIPVIRPASKMTGDKYPQIALPTEIDRLVDQKLRKLGIVPSEKATDAEFLRRLSLDMTGTLPTAFEVREFVADTSNDKRTRKVEELLESEAYAAWWTTRLCDWTGNNEYELRNVTPGRSQPAGEWYNWIRQRVETNTPYDEIVAGLVLGNGRTAGQSFEEYCAEMSNLYRPGSEAEFADRETMQWFWARRSVRQPEEKALSFAYTFMGIRIQCAQCHKHPFDQWTQDDYKEFTKFFTNIRFGTDPETRQEYAQMQKDLGLAGKRGNDLRRALPDLLKSGKVVPFQEVFTTPVRARKNQRTRKNNNKYVTADGSAKLLGADTVDLTEHDDPRAPLMAWLRDADNPFFARAFVNRVWENYFGVGIVSPTDDLSLANPPSNGPLLDYLAQGFIENDFDMKWLHREIVLSDAYQRSWKPNETNTLDERNFSRAIPRRLPAEVAYDALKLATASDAEVTEMQESLKRRAIALPGASTRGNYGQAGYALTIFGRSVRESNCDCDRSSEPSLLQTVYLRNDRDLHSMLQARNGWLREMTQKHDLGPVRESVQQRPANYEKVMTNFKNRLARAEKQNNKKLAKNIRQQMRKYTARFGGVPDAKAKPQGMAGEEVSNTVLARLVEEAYLRSLSRFPTDEERERSLQHLRQSESKAQGLEDLLWALLNTKEFIVNH